MMPTLGGHDLQMAKAFLAALDPSAEKFSFQTFVDDKSSNDARCFHGSLEEHWNTLVGLNTAGHGIYVTANETNLSGRKKKDIVRPRAVFRENDTPGLPELPVRPHIVVETSPGKRHEYLLVKDAPVDEFEPVQERLVADYGSDPNAKDISRVLRLPGFYHQKDRNNPHLVRIISTSGAPPTPWTEVKRVFPPVPRREPAPLQESPGQLVANVEEIRSALGSLDPDMGYQRWLCVGMGLHHHFDGGSAGLEIWENWSLNGSKYRPGECGFKYNSFTSCKHEPVTIGTVFQMANDAGWNNGLPDAGAIFKASTPATNDNKFQLVPAHSLKTNKPLEWQIEGIMELCAFCLMFGDSGTMKSFLALDMALCVATGVPYHGRKVNRGPVVIVIGEGLHGYGRRIAAWEKFHGIDLTGHPVFVSTMAAQFLDDSSAAEVETAINSVSAKHGQVALVVLDTLNRNFGAGDENSTLDMTKFIAAIDRRIGNRVTRLVVHHTGHANKERARGAYALKAALDCEIQVMKNDEKISMLNSKQKDAPEFSPITFEPRVVELGARDLTSLVMVKCDPSINRSLPKLSMQQIEALSLLTLMNRKIGLSCLSEWRHLCSDEKVYGKSAFYTAIKTMEEKKVIVISDGYVRRS